MQYNLLFRWFIKLSMNDAVWAPTVFTTNREHLPKHDAVIRLFNEGVAIAQERDLLSAASADAEHLLVLCSPVLALGTHMSVLLFVPLSISLIGLMVASAVYPQATRISAGMFVVAWLAIGRFLYGLF